MTKTIVGYCDPFSVPPGQQVELKVSAAEPASCLLDVVRIICGDPSSKGPGFTEELVPRPDGGGWPSSIAVRHQPLHPGSYGEVPAAAAWLEDLRSCTVAVLVQPTRAGAGEQLLVRIGTAGPAGASLTLGLDEDGHVVLDVAGERLRLDRPLTVRRWWRVIASYDATFGQLRLRQVPLPTRSPADRLLLAEARAELAADELIGLKVGGGVRFAGPFDGRLEDRSWWRAPPMTSTPHWPPATPTPVGTSRWASAPRPSTIAGRTSCTAGCSRPRCAPSPAPAGTAPRSAGAMPPGSTPPSTSTATT
ncbi:MAG: hypothetical protein R2749_09510 [Acidimicrobiales bacterium]